MGLPVRKESDNVDGDLLLELYEVFLQQISKHEDIRFDPSFLLFIEQPLLWERSKGVGKLRTAQDLPPNLYEKALRRPS